MTQTYFPFATGSGSNVTQAQWGQMAQYWMSTGVIKGALNELSVYADSTGMQCKVKSGNAWIQGFYFQSDAEVVMPISAANATNPRIDRVALQVDWTNNNISIIILQGTPASSPTPPALTQNTSLWQISLAQVYVGANVSTIAAGNITDERSFTQNANIVASGSNSNGNYIRYADGLQICWKNAVLWNASQSWTLDATSGINYNYISGVWTFPASFVSGATIALEATGYVGGIKGVERHALIPVDNTKANWEHGVLSNTGPAGYSANTTYQHLAIGYWK